MDYGLLALLALLCFQLPNAATGTKPLLLPQRYPLKSPDQVCQGLPGITPNNTRGWSPSCGNAKSGMLCMAKCQEGFTGAYVSACMGTQWQPPSGACLPKKAAAIGQATAVAQAGMAPPPTCTNGVASSTCYPDPSICWGPPPGPNPPATNSTYWPAAYASYNGSSIIASCEKSLVGFVISYCLGGSWTQPVGGCYRDPTKCYTPPDKPSALRVKDWPTSEYWNDGEAIVTTCVNYQGGGEAMAKSGRKVTPKMAFYYSLARPEVVSTCSAGKWSNPMGTCYTDPRICMSTPADSPAAPNAVDWPTGNIYYAGDYISTYCKSGYVGEVRSVCNPMMSFLGNWSAPFGSCFKANNTARISCRSRPRRLPVNAVTWNRYSCDTSNGGFCKADCRPGYIGWAGVQCQNGIWSSSMGMCYKDRICPNEPPVTAPNSDGWAWCDRNEGKACFATCKPGYVGSPVPVSFCQKGRWTPIQGKCVPKATCPKVPPFLPANAESWDYCNTQEGGMCRANCKGGWVGAVTSVCSRGIWQPAQGACVPDNSTCSGKPPFLPPNTVGWPDCWDKREGAACMAECATGYRGTVVSYCSGGRWSAAAGSCEEDTTVCSGVPDDVPGTDGWSVWNCFNYEGGYCVAECTEPLVGSPVSFCSQGVWSKPQGSCWAPTATVCTSGPPELALEKKASTWTDPNGRAGCAESSEGTACVASCVSGYVGGYFSVCNAAGGWDSPVGGCYKDPQYCYDPPAMPSSNRSHAFPSTVTHMEGAETTTYCQYPYQGSYQTICWGGQFTELSGGCYKSDSAPSAMCFGPPSAAMKPENSDWSWECSSYYGRRHGDTCRAYCNNGYVGAPVFYCLDGQWVSPPGVPNACRRANSSCSFADLPPLPENAVSWGSWYNCGSEGAAEEGRTCYTYCNNNAPFGTPTIQCRAGKWEIVQGSCLPAPSTCVGSPAFEVLNLAYWDQYQISEGQYAAGHCSYGYVGTVLSYCKGGQLQTPIGSCEPEQACRGLPIPPLPGNATSWYCNEYTANTDGDLCVAQCDNGYVGAPYSMCRNGTYTAIEGSCIPDPGYCKGAPKSIATGTSGWSCEQTPEGGICKATCLPGPKGDLVGTWVTTCKSGAYASPLSSNCHTRKGACTSGPSASPGPYSQDWPDCSNTPDGGTCETSCIDGYDGAMIAVCQGNNVWSVFGSCKKSTFKCYLPPANPPAANAYNWPVIYGPTYQGDFLAAQCIDGYVGSVITTCLGNNKWSPVQGSCYKRPTSCFGPPPFNPGPNSGTWSVAVNVETRDGDYTSVYCLSDFTGVYTAICHHGKWAGPYGNCTKEPNTCWSAPPKYDGPAEDWVLWGQAYSHGSTIEASCLSGYVGKVQATCNKGSWKVGGGCWRPTLGCYGVPSTSPGNTYSWPTSFYSVPVGRAVTASCKSGYKRDIMNVCLPGGLWRDPACIDSADCQWPPNGGLIQACAGFEYIAQAGDTISSIATNMCEVQLTSVTAVNPHIADFTKICPGDSICCPVCKASTLPAPPGVQWGNCLSMPSGAVCAGTCKAGCMASPSAPSSTCSAGYFMPITGGCVEACTIRIQLINNAVRDVLVLTDVVLVAKDKTILAYNALAATLSSSNTSLPINNCFDNNNATRCSAASADTAPTLTINYPCSRGLSAVKVINRKDCCQTTINKFKLVFVKSVNGTAPDYTFTNGLSDYTVTGPNPYV